MIGRIELARGLLVCLELLLMSGSGNVRPASAEEAVRTGPATENRLAHPGTVDAATLDAEIKRLTQKIVELGQQKNPNELLETHAKLVDRTRQRYPASEFPNGHVDLARALLNQGSALLANQHLGEAETAAKHSMEMINRLDPELKIPADRSVYSEAAAVRFKSLERNGGLTKAQIENREVIKKLRQAHAFHNDISGLLDLAPHLILYGRTELTNVDWCNAMAALDEARDIYRRRIIEVTQHNKGSIENIVEVRNFVAASTALDDLFTRTQQPTRRLTNAKESFDFIKSSFNSNEQTRINGLLITLLDRFGKASLDVGNYKDAVRCYEESITLIGHGVVADSVVGTNKSTLLCNLALAERAAGQLLSARMHINSALGIASENLSRNANDNNKVAVASIWNAKGLIAFESDLLIESKASYHNAIDVYKELNSRKSPPVSGEIQKRLSSAIGNLTVTLVQLGEYGAAAELAVEHLKRLRQAYDPARFPQGHRDLVVALRNLSEIHIEFGEMDKARASLDECAELCRRLGLPTGTEADRIAWSRTLHSYADVCIEMRDYDNAEALLNEALSIVSQSALDQLPDLEHLIACKCRLSYVWLMQGKIDAALNAAEEGVSTARKIGGENRRTKAWLPLIRGLNYLARCHLSRSDFNSAWDCHVEATELAQAYAESQAINLSEVESLNVIGRYLQPQMGLLNSWKGSRQSAAKLYELLWRRRGLVHRLLADRREALEEIGGQRVRELHARRREIATSLSNLAVGSNDIPGQSTEKIAALTQEREAIERDMASLVTTHRDRSLWSDCQLHDLRSTLPKGYVFVDIMILPRLNLPGDPSKVIGPRSIEYRYMGFVVPSGAEPAIVDLGNVEEIDGDVELLREKIGKHEPIDGIAKSISNKVWVPIETRLSQGTHTVLICPDGLLTALPWVALPRGNGQQMVLESYSVAVVPAGHFLVQQLDNVSSTSTGEGLLLMVGGVDFDSLESRTATSLVAGTRGPLVDEVRRWTALPGTTTEIDGIEEIAKNRHMTVLRSREATVSRITACLPQARWVHFATHGFFANSQYRSILDATSSTAGNRPEFVSGSRSGRMARNPLLLSGLVFAGANDVNRRVVGSPGEDACSVLTSEGISLLDLSRAHLVTLSACDTGLGDIAGREGVLGLQRAFHLAGARNVVASLWKVDDESTSILMRLFYENLWGKKMTPLAALRAAQLHILNHPSVIAGHSAVRGVNFKAQIARGESSSSTVAPRTPPHLWASFVLSGVGQ